MGFFGREFVDLRTIVGSVGDRVTLGPDAVLAVKREIDRNLLINGPGAILYLAPGVYELIAGPHHYGTWDGDMDIPANVTLWFEPGALIVLKGTRLVISGGIVASRRQIFQEDEGGLVLFAANPDALLPEWWGASASPDVDSTDGIQRALDAGSARRMPVQDGASNTARRPIPVLLHELYSVRRPVELGRQVQVAMRPGSTGVNTFGIPTLIATTLRGVTRGTATPSAGLRAGPRTFAGRELRNVGEPALSLDPTPPQSGPFRVLVHVDSAQGAIIEDLILDGSLLADYGLVIEGGITSGGDQEQAHSIALRNCTVTGARRVQVQIGAPQRLVSRDEPWGSQLVPVEADPNSGSDVLGLSIDACDIVCPPGINFPSPIGVQLRAQNGVAIRISNCSFRGHAAAFVDAISTTALIEGCDFENQATPAAIYSHWGADSLERRGTEAPDASDIYLGVEGAASGTRPLQPPSATPAVAVSGCRSRSERFFSTISPSPFTPRSARSNLIYGVQHAPAPGRVPPSWVRRTSVYWGRQRLSEFAPHAVGASPSLNRDATLCVVGSSLAFGMKVGIGAAQSVMLACAMPWPEARTQFIPAQPETPDDNRVAITAPTIIFGFVLVALALLGCDRSTVPVMDASHDGAETHVLDAGVDVMDFAAYFDRALADLPRRDLILPPLEDVPVLTDLPPPTQARYECPLPTDGDPTIAPPRLVFPLSPLRVTSRQPRVVWELAPETNGARVEFCRDRCCTQVIETIDTLGTFATPTAMLPPGVVFWRARGRLGERVGRDVSFTWEFGVRHHSAPIDTAWGTVRDFNGDGYDDLAATVRGRDRAYLRMYWGGSDGLNPARQQTVPFVGRSPQIAVGDFNGDGFADTVGNGLWQVLDPVGRILVASGSPSGVRVTGATVPAGIGHLAAIDINGDGFCDVVAAAPVTPGDPMQMRSILVFFGSPAGLGAGGRQEVFDPTMRLPFSGCGVIGAGADLNGDGFGDVVVGDPYYGGGDFSHPGRVYVFRGRSYGLDPSPIRVIEVPSWERGGTRVRRSASRCRRPER